MHKDIACEVVCTHTHTWHLQWCVRILTCNALAYHQQVAINATLESAEIMLTVIRDLGVQATVGFKPAGGVKTAQDAKAYLDLADSLLGPDWADARHFRFGASSLRPALLSTLEGGDGAAGTGY